MNHDYEAYERECAAIYKTNEIHLSGFEEWLINSGLAARTVSKHVSNVDFYINVFLCYYDAWDVRQGCYNVDMFLGDWFIRKAMWSSCSHIKLNVASLKKFYSFLLSVNVIEQTDYASLCSSIKQGLPEWLNEMKRYDDESLDY